MLGNDGVVNNSSRWQGRKQQFLANRPGFSRSSTFQASGKRGVDGASFIGSINRGFAGTVEAAMIDGADRFQRMSTFTGPDPLHIVILLLLAFGNTMNAGLDQILTCTNPVHRLSENIGYVHYRITSKPPAILLQPAVGLFNRYQLRSAVSV
jgi:ABC-type polysaccharide transport system permease subunit